MRAHFAHLSDFLYRVAHKVDLYVGVGAGLIFLLVAFFLSIGEQTVLTVTVAIAAVSLTFSSYEVYREERQMRAERESHIRVTASLGAFAPNLPEPGPDEASFTARVVWEMWTDRDVTIDQMALNVIYQYDRRWWQFWKKVRVPQKGMPQQGADTRQFRKTVRAENTQPHRDIAIFEYVGEREAESDPHWLLEFVLITGLPVGEHRIPVYIPSEDDLRARGANLPL